MWIWKHELKQLGFRQKSRTYWQALGRFGLEPDEYVSAFLCTSNTRRGANATLFQLTEFHVTFPIMGHRVHFYFHETMDRVWEAGGHTSVRELTLLGAHLPALDRQALQAASQLLAATGSRWRDEDEDGAEEI